MADEDSVLLTADGLSKLKLELTAVHERRLEAADRLKEAFQPGDIEDNPEYESAKEEVNLLDARIYELTELIGRAQLITEHHGEVVEAGSTVEVEDDTGHKEVYHLVGAVESDPALGRISLESPVGKALLGRRRGDSVTVPVPDGNIRLKLIKVS